MGSKGPAVVELQTKLNLVGAASPPLATDGDFGPLTRTAVTTFQASSAPPADGIAGPLTWGALDAATGGQQPAGGGGTGSGFVEPVGANIPGPVGGGGGSAQPGTTPATVGPGAPQIKLQATAGDIADEQACAALPASQMGAAVNEVISWQSPLDDLKLLVRLSEIVCFPTQYRLFVAGFVVALLPPLPGTPQREAMLAHVVQALDDFKVALEMAKSPAVLSFGLPQISDDQAKRISDRIEALRAIAAAESSAQTSEKRLAAVMLAAGEVGKVDHKLLVGGRRFGADRLLEYFNVAFGGTIPASQVQTINNPPANVKSRLSCAISPQPCDPLAPWCGIFASWALQSGGISLPPWNLQDGKGLNQRGAWTHLKPGEEIRPGDLATRVAGNHQALVTIVKPDEIETAEGNTNEGGGTGLEAALGGKIVHKKYPRKGGPNRPDLGFPQWDTGFFRPPGAD